MVVVLVPVKKRHDPHQPRSRWAILRRVLWRLLAGSASFVRIGPRLITLCLIAAIIWSWGTPHLRLQYAYTGLRANPTYVWCDYVGLQQFKQQGPDCPLFIWRPIPKEWLQKA